MQDRSFFWPHRFGVSLVIFATRMPARRSQCGPVTERWCLPNMSRANRSTHRANGDVTKKRACGHGRSSGIAQARELFGRFDRSCVVARFFIGRRNAAGFAFRPGVVAREVRHLWALTCSTGSLRPSRFPFGSASSRFVLFNVNRNDPVPARRRRMVVPQDKADEKILPDILGRHMMEQFIGLRPSPFEECGQPGFIRQ